MIINKKIEHTPKSYKEKKCASKTVPSDNQSKVSASSNGSQQQKELKRKKMFAVNQKLILFLVFFFPFTKWCFILPNTHRCLLLRVPAKILHFN